LKERLKESKTSLRLREGESERNRDKERVLKNLRKLKRKKNAQF
jgi:hypothetical protein